MLSNLTLCRLHWYPKNQQAIVKADFEYEGVKYTNQRASLNGAAFRALEAVPNKEQRERDALELATGKYLKSGSRSAPSSQLPGHPMAFCAAVRWPASRLA